tara:strand:+ start:570 stop:914 length:345 start_codon:yes stop_codon:yes gene_type:complete
MAHNTINMKFETLITRYKNLGYEPKGLERDLEIASLIKWLYEKHDIYVDVSYCNMKFPPINGMPVYLRFNGIHIWDTKEDYNSKQICNTSFKNPFDAKFDAVRDLYKALKFQKY